MPLTINLTENVTGDTLSIVLFGMSSNADAAALGMDLSSSFRTFPRNTIVLKVSIAPIRFVLPEAQPLVSLPANRCMKDTIIQSLLLRRRNKRKHCFIFERLIIAHSEFQKHSVLLHFAIFLQITFHFTLIILISQSIILNFAVLSQNHSHQFISAKILLCILKRNPASEVQCFTGWVV